jgi:hypothetical protein
MVLRLIVLCLPTLTACAAEGNFPGGPPATEPVAQVNSEDGSPVPPEGEFPGGPPATEPVAQVNSEDGSPVPPEGEFPGGPPAAEPSIRFNFVMEDVMTEASKWSIQEEPREAEPTYSPM